MRGTAISANAWSLAEWVVHWETMIKTEYTALATFVGAAAVSLTKGMASFSRRNDGVLTVCELGKTARLATDSSVLRNHYSCKILILLLFRQQHRPIRQSSRRSPREWRMKLWMSAEDKERSIFLSLQSTLHRPKSSKIIFSSRNESPIALGIVPQFAILSKIQKSREENKKPRTLQSQFN